MPSVYKVCVTFAETCRASMEIAPIEFINGACGRLKSIHFHTQNPNFTASCSSFNGFTGFIFLPVQPFQCNEGLLVCCTVTTSRNDSDCVRSQQSSPEHLIACVGNSATFTKWIHIELQKKGAQMKTSQPK